MDSGPTAAPPSGGTGEPWPLPGQPPQPPSRRRRLYREPDDKKLAGICGGLGDYTGVDPALVRAWALLLVVLAPFTAVAYLVAMLAIDERPPSVPRVVAPPVDAVERRRWLSLLVIACAVLIAGGGTWWWPSFDVPLVAPLLIGVGVWLLVRGHDGRSDPSDGPAPGSGPLAGPPGPPRTTVDPGVQMPWSSAQEAFRSPSGDEGAGPPGGVPPLTPPEGPGPEAAADLWPASPAPPASASAVMVDDRGSQLLGLAVTALVLIGGGAVWFLYAADMAEVDPRSALAVGLVIVGAGLVIAAWWGRARAVLIPLGLVAVVVLASAEVLDVPLDAGVGDRTVVVGRRSELDQPIELLMGELVVDLRDVPLSTRRPTDVRVGLGIGELRVLVPREADVVVDTDVRVGSVGGALTAGRDDDDVGALLDETYVLDGQAGAARLDLTLDVGIGDVEVIRG